MGRPAATREGETQEQVFPVRNRDAHIAKDRPLQMQGEELPASEGGRYTNFQPSTFNFEPPFSGPGNILRGGHVLLDRGAQGCLPRRGCGERGALC